MSGLGPIWSTKSCSDVSELEDNSRSFSKVREIAKKLPSNLWKALGVVTSFTLFLFIVSLFYFILFYFPCLCASSSFAHLSSVLVESHSPASVLRESLQLLFFLDVSMHSHFIKQSGYPKLFELTRISKLPWSCNLFSERKIAGMWRFCNNCQELEQSKNGLF